MSPENILAEVNDPICLNAGPDLIPKLGRLLGKSAVSPYSLVQVQHSAKAIE